MKRLLDENEDGPPRRKRPTLLSVGREVIRLQLMQRLLGPSLEPIVRRVVREELERAFMQVLPSVPRPSINRIQAPGAIGPKLHCNSWLPDTLFTGSKISPVQVVICSGSSEELVTTGLLSSTKVEMVVLDGDFGKDEKEDWTKEEFDACVVRERDGRRPLLTGDLIITLRDGVGTFGNVTFTDNSSWIRGRRFRLGVKVLQGSGIEERIREARSKPFVVKDHRGELYKKHDSPSLTDEIWRLKNIGKDGVFRKRLTVYGIETVQQFLRFLVTDPARLRRILGLGMSNKVWDETISHARKCVLDDKYYIYFNTGREFGILLNSIYEVVKVTFDGCQSFQSLDNLTPFHKNLVESLKQQAYGNQKDILDFNGLPIFGPARTLPELPETSLTLQNAELITHQNELTLLDFMNSTNPPPRGQLMIDLPQLKDIPFAPDVHLNNLFDPILSNNINMFVGDEQLENTVIPQDRQLSRPFATILSNSVNMTEIFRVPSGDYGNGWSASGSAGTVLPNRHLLTDYPQVQMPNRFNGPLQVPSDEIGSTSFLNPSQLPGLSSISMGKVMPKGWRKLGAPLKWGILVRKDVAAKRMAEFCI